MAVDNETVTSEPVDTAPLSEDVEPAETAETIVPPEEPTEVVEETVDVSTPTSAELVAEAIEEYDQKITDRTAEALSDAEPTDTVRVLVRYKGASARDADLSRVDVSVTEMTVADAAALLENDDVAALEVDQVVDLFADMVPWGVNRTGAPDVWGDTTGSGVAVGIVDTGIASHADLNIAGGTSVVGGSYADTYGHGTAVAGVVAAVADSSGLVGVAPDVDLYAIKVMNGSSGQLSDVVAGIDWAINNDIDVLVMSFGTEDYSQILEDALDEAADAGMLLVAAAGNDGGDVRYPAAYDDVIAVGSIDDDDTIAASSNTGPELELVAPGINVNTTWLTGYTVLDGTSLATPHVAGVAALVWSHNASLSAAQVRNVLRSTALDLGDSGRDNTYGYGVVQAALASGNSSPVNDSYFYEVWNITEYDTANETLTFWTNGTGTYEDLNFTPGYYRVTLYLSPPVNTTLFVNESGEISALILNMLFLTDFAEANPTDRVVWEEGDLEYKATDSPTAPQVVCFDEDYSGTLSYIACYATSGSALTACKSTFEELDDYCSFGSCSSTGSSSYHDFDPGNIDFRTESTIAVKGFYSCSGSPSTTLSLYSYAVVDRKRAVCEGMIPYYNIEGHVAVNTWIEVNTYACATDMVCDPLRSGMYNATSETYDFHTSSGANYPCRVADGNACDHTDGSTANDCLTGHYCLANGTCSSTNVAVCIANGTIDVSVDVLGSGYANANVFINNVSKGVTDIAGLKSNIAVVAANCDTDINVTVKCADNSTVCKTRTTQMDFQGDEDSLSFDCSLACGGTKDMYLSQSSTWVNLTNKNITLTVWSRGLTQSGVVVNISRQDYTGVIVNSTTLTVNAVAGAGVNVSTTYFSNLDAADHIHVWLDPANAVSNEDNSNNYLFRPAVKPVSVYLYSMSVDPTYEAAEPVIREYLGQYVELVPSSSDAQVLLDVGSWPEASISGVGMYGPTGAITKPYGASVSSVRIGSQLSVSVRGIGIEGVLAGVKRLVAARSLFLVNSSGSYTSYIDDYDVAGIGMFDQLHAPEALTAFNQPSTTQFSELVNNVLNDNNFEPAIKTVKTLNTTSYGESTILRVKHLNVDFTDDYKDAFSISEVPVVFSGGIFSSLETWEGRSEVIDSLSSIPSGIPGVNTVIVSTRVERKGLAAQLAKEGREVWEIEMTGGPGTDCSGQSADTCPNYTYNDLVDYYWPASMAGISEYSGVNQFDYVGHSNGCRAALSSLNNYSNNGKNAAGYYFDYDSGTYINADLPSRPVRKFVGVACPIVLDHKSDGTNTTFTYLARHAQANGFSPMERLAGDAHVTLAQYGSKLVSKGYLFDPAELTTFLALSAAPDSETISYNLMEFYHSLAVSPSSSFDLSRVFVDEVYFMNGNTSDLIVPFEDQNYALNSAGLNSSIQKMGFSYQNTIKNSTVFAELVYNHVSIKGIDAVIQDIREVLS